MKRWVRTSLFTFATLCIAANANAQARPFAGSDVQKIYEHLLAQIDRIPIYDNHA